MTDGPRLSPLSEFLGRVVAAPVLAAYTAIVVALASLTPFPLAGTAVAVTAALLTAGLYGRRASARRPFAPVPAFASLAFAAVLAPPTFLAEALSGFAAVVLLVWMASAGGGWRGRRSRIAALAVFPAIAVLLALAVAAIVPSGTSLLGVGALLLAGALGLTAYGLGRSTGSGPSPAGSETL